MPGPSFRPLLGAIGTTALMFGLVFGGWVAAAGVLILIWTLIGWLVDARAEFKQTVLADQTGHLENIPEPRWPTAFFQVAGVVFVLAVLLQAGILPPKVPETAGGGEGPGASGAPPPSVEAKTAWAITAQGIKFDLKEIAVPADQAFTIDFTNADPAGVTHDIDVRQTDRTTEVQSQEVVNGGDKATYRYDGLPAGTYDFVCSIHSNMTGTIVSK
jgi:plastocyanin